MIHYCEIKRSVYVGILSGNPKDEPMHYGEVIGAWAFIGANNGLISGYEAFINHAGDEDLINLLKESIQMMQSETKEVGKLLKANGVALPPTLPERPKANADDIPAGGSLHGPRDKWSYFH